MERLVFTDTLWVKNFAKFTHSGMVFEIQVFLCFAIFAKNSKIQNGRHSWQVKYSLKLVKDSLHRYPMGQKICQIHALWHGFRDTSIFVFCKKFENSKWPPFLASEIFIETCKG